MSELISRSGRDHFGKDLISSKYRAGITDIQGSTYVFIFLTPFLFHTNTCTFYNFHFQNRLVQTSNLI